MINRIFEAILALIFAVVLIMALGSPITNLINQLTGEVQVIAGISLLVIIIVIFTITPLEKDKTI